MGRKTAAWAFQATNEKSCVRPRKWILKKETESLLKAAQNAIRVNYVKARIDKTQQNSRCR